MMADKPIVPLCSGKQGDSGALLGVGGKTDNAAILSELARVRFDKSAVTPQMIKSLICFDGMGYLWLERPRWMFESDMQCRLWNARHAGKPALNSRTSNGYLRVAFFGHSFLAHRVIWAYHYSEWPVFIDHIRVHSCLPDCRGIAIPSIIAWRKIHSTIAD